MQRPTVYSKSEGQYRGPSWPQTLWSYELWKSHLSALLINPITLIFHLHSVPAETPVVYNKSIQKIGVKSEAKLNHVLSITQELSYFTCFLKMGFLLMRSIKLMTLINYIGGGVCGGVEKLGI